MTHGLLLAAGAGRRMGRPKALVEDWLARSVAALADGGCTGVTVVLGADADRAAALVPPGVAVVVAEHWDRGMGASLAAGLGSLGAGDSRPAAALVHLVDLPDVGAPVVGRVLATPVTTGSLARAAYAGVPGHPVLLGRDHWPGVSAVAEGDVGARDYLRAHPPLLVECGDLAGGADVDQPPMNLP